MDDWCEKLRRCQQIPAPPQFVATFACQLLRMLPGFSIALTLQLHKPHDPVQMAING